jgi:hypothetical protein
MSTLPIDIVAVADLVNDNQYNTSGPTPDANPRRQPITG